MIDVHQPHQDAEFGPVVVSSAAGMPVGVFWGTRFEICEAIDEITDPNGCKYRICPTGGIHLGCFHGEEELTVAAYNEAQASTFDDDSLEMRFEGVSHSALEWLGESDSQWLPIVPAGYQYLAGGGLTKIDTEWN